MQTLFHRTMADLDTLFEKSQTADSLYQRNQHIAHLSTKCSIAGISVTDFLFIKFAETQPQQNAVTAVTANLSATRPCRNCGGEIPSDKKATAIYCKDVCRAEYSRKKQNNG